MNLTHLFTRNFKRKSTISYLAFQSVMKANGYVFLFNYSHEESMSRALETVNQYGYDYVLGPAYASNGVFMDTYRSLYVKVPKTMFLEFREAINGS